MKNVFTYNESRCGIAVSIEGHMIATTHAEDKNKPLSAELRENHAGQFATTVKAFAHKWKCKSTTVVGDMNSVNLNSYSPTQRELMLQALNNSPDHATNKLSAVPSEAADIYRTAFGNEVNFAQQGESNFQKCVTLAYSDRFTRPLPFLTDATGFDHQPLLIVADPLYNQSEVQALHSQRLQNIENNFKFNAEQDAPESQPPPRVTHE